MTVIFNDYGFSEKVIKCDQCGWQGKGRDAHLIDLYGLTNVQQVECPDCNSYLGDLKSTDDPDGAASPANFQIW